MGPTANAVSGILEGILHWTALVDVVSDGKSSIDVFNLSLILKSWYLTCS